MKVSPLFDAHIHILALDSPKDKNYGIILKRTLSKNLAFNKIARYHNISLSDPDFNVKYIDQLNSELQNSVHVKTGIVFGMDGVYDQRGKFNSEATTVYVSNDYVYNAIKGKKSLKFGASINPARKDAIDELEKAAERGAGVIKFLPNVQGFAPDNKNFKKFYRKMAEFNIPLLSHTGFEFAFEAINQSFGHPERLRVALDEGVTVIAAHGCATGLIFIELYKKHILNLIKTYPHFFMDMSALSIHTRWGILPFLLKYQEARERLVFGTDYPLPIKLYPFYTIVGSVKFHELKKIKNYFDRYAELMTACGFLTNSRPIKFKI